MTRLPRQANTVQPGCGTPRLRYGCTVCILVGVPSQRKVRRYSAYFKGWCQAFGEHENLSAKEHGINWLLAENQVGLILPAELTKALYREVLGRQRESPTLTIGQDCVRVGEFHYQLSATADKPGIDALRQALEKLVICTCILATTSSTGPARELLPSRGINPWPSFTSRSVPCISS